MKNLTKPATVPAIVDNELFRVLVRALSHNCESLMVETAGVRRGGNHLEKSGIDGFHPRLKFLASPGASLKTGFWNSIKGSPA